MPASSCVVCEAPAKVYCEADKAFLCAECDHKVHSSNPLAARHTRFPVCELCKGSASAVFCCNDKAYLCDLCDAAVHSDNPLAARHTIVPAAQALAGQIGQESASESDAQSEAECGRPKKAKVAAAESPACGDESAAVVGTGSEAVVPVLDCLPGSPTLCGGDDLPAADACDASAGKAPWGKEFDFLDLDNGWLDRLEVGLDFSDILADAPSEAGLVPTFDGGDEADTLDDELGAVPVIDISAQQQQQQQPMEHQQSMSGSLSLELAVPSSFQVPFSGPPMSAMQPMAPPHAAYFQPPAGSVWQTIYPAIQASPFYPNPASFPVVTKDQATMNREQRVNRYREKRKHRKFEKTIRYASRKAYAEVRPRIKGRFARKDELEAWARGDDLAVVPEL